MTLTPQESDSEQRWVPHVGEEVNWDGSDERMVVLAVYGDWVWMVYANNPGCAPESSQLIYVHPVVLSLLEEAEGLVAAARDEGMCILISKGAWAKWLAAVDRQYQGSNHG